MNVASTLTSLMHAINTLEDARKSCEYDQSYFLSREIKNVEDAESDYIRALKNELGMLDLGGTP